MFIQLKNFLSGYNFFSDNIALKITYLKSACPKMVELTFLITSLASLHKKTAFYSLEHSVPPTGDQNFKHAYPGNW